MHRSIKRGVGIALIVIGILLLLNSFSSITGFVISENIGKTTSSLLGILSIILGIVLILTTDLEHLVGMVKGTNPITKHESHSPLYSRISPKNINEIFQTPLRHKYGKEIMGAKAIVYKADDGSYHTAFLTESIDTHHRHAAATVARLVEGVKLSDPSYLNDKADALYEGDSARSAQLLSQTAGFELQFDPDTKKIIGIQQDSWLTKEQNRCGRKLSKVVEDDMIMELLTSIDDSYLSDSMKNLSEKDLEKLYAGRKIS